MILILIFSAPHLNQLIKFDEIINLIYEIYENMGIFGNPLNYENHENLKFLANRENYVINMIYENLN